MVSSLSGRETGRSNHSGYNTVTKSYTFDYNDDSLVPTSNNGYALSSISWSEGEYMDDSGIPENYVATATYRKGYSYSTVDGWEYTMSYVGDVTFKREDTIKYTLVYTGELIEEPGFWESVFGNKNNSTDVGTSDPNLTAPVDGTNTGPVFLALFPLGGRSWHFLYHRRNWRGRLWCIHPSLCPSRQPN